MCTLLISYRQHADYPLLIAANRDEFLERDTRALHWWTDNPDILGGRDGAAGGTWFGLHRNGRIATLTNHRSFPLKTDAPSRGDLVRDFLEGSQSPAEYAERLSAEGDRYNGFNLLFGRANDLWYANNRGGESGPLPAGIHGLSNAVLNSPWPKVDAGKKTFSTLFAEPAALRASDVYSQLGKRDTYPDEQLPNTGIGLDRERVLSALFIETEGYGTRASWFLRVAANGHTEVMERSYAPAGDARVVLRLPVEHPA